MWRGYGDSVCWCEDYVRTCSFSSSQLRLTQQSQLQTALKDIVNWEEELERGAVEMKSLGEDEMQLCDVYLSG